MPSRKFMQGNVEYIEVDIPYAAHGNLLAGIKAQGCWELDFPQRELERVIGLGFGHNRCLQNSPDADRVIASREIFDRYGFITGQRKSERAEGSW